MTGSSLRISLAIIFLVCGSVSTPAKQETPQPASRPAALEEFLKRRSALRTAEMDITDTDYWSALQRSQKALPHFSTVMIAGEHHVIVFRGDSEGVTMRTPEGKPHPMLGSEPSRTYSEPGQSISRRSNDLLQGATLARVAAHQVEDYRTLGLGRTGCDLESSIDGWRAKDAPPPRYTEYSEGGLRVVERETDNDVTKFWIDPDRDWNVVRMRNETKQGYWSETRSELEQMDGVWFPRKSSTFISQYKNGEQPVRICEVNSATFNRPEHMQELSPASIGMEAGMDVTVLSQLTPETKNGKWTGTEVVSYKEYVDRAVRGEVRDGPGFTAAVIRKITGQANGGEDGSAPVATTPTGDSPTPGSASKPSEASRVDKDSRWGDWERYVREFIAKFELDDEQQQKATLILQRCEVRGDTFLATKADELKKLEDKRSVPDTRQAADEKLQKLLAPINDIFEKRLKPDLDKIPTRAQRAAALKRAGETPKP